MGKNTLTKVMKYELRYLDGCGSFEEMQKNLWALHKQVRTIMNRTIQMAYHWDFENQKHFRETGEYLDLSKETGYKDYSGYIYDYIKKDYADMSAANLNAAIRKAWQKYNESKKKIRQGEMSIPSYKADQPLPVHHDNVKLWEQDGQVMLDLTLFSRAFQKAQNCSTRVTFSVRLNDETQKSIMRNVLSGEYGYGQCQLVYDRPKWFFYLTYTFPTKQLALDPDRILGVDLGECVAVYASTWGEHGGLRIEGGEISAFARKMEARIRSMQKQAAVCGEGRRGHGTKTRVSSVYKAKDKVASFRDTINHRYSKALVDYAVKTNCGVIQMEDLKGIKEDTGYPKILRHWTYYDLQNKIETKAKERGIVVRKIDPQYTSKRCSRCGHIDDDNRKTQAQFVCTKCGFKANADYNASQNISIKNIDTLIKEYMGAKSE